VPCRWKVSEIRQAQNPKILRVKFHSLKHFYATIQLISVINPKIVREGLGHSTITLTLDTYSHIIPTLQKEAAENINKVFKP
jgi:integrase